MPTPDKEAQSMRVKEFMNYQIMDEMKEYESEFDQMLFYYHLQDLHLKKCTTMKLCREQYQNLFLLMT